MQQSAFFEVQIYEPIRFPLSATIPEQNSKSLAQEFSMVCVVIICSINKQWNTGGCVFSIYMVVMKVLLLLGII